VVDDLLRTALDLGVAALHRVEVQVGGVGAGRHREAAPPPMPMRMPGPPSWKQRAGGKFDLLGLAAGCPGRRRS
jgi:hypothetical protein